MSEASPAVTATEKKPAVVWFGAVLYWVMSVFTSLVASSDYELPIAMALATALLFFRCAYWLSERANLLGKLVLLVLAVPLGMLTVDNVGRALNLLGAPWDRVFGPLLMG